MIRRELERGGPRQWSLPRRISRPTDLKIISAFEIGVGKGHLYKTRREEDPRGVSRKKGTRVKRDIRPSGRQWVWGRGERNSKNATEYFTSDKSSH